MAMTLQNTYPTNPPIGYAGQIVGPIENCEIITVKNAEASAKIPFGRAVVWKTSSPTTDLDVILPATENDLVAGIVINLKSYQPTYSVVNEDGTVQTAGELDPSAGLIPGTFMAILQRGRILVPVEDGCVPTDRLWVRAVAAGDPEFLGGLNSADDSTDMIDCTKQGQFYTTATATNLAELYVDFTRKP